MLQETPDRLLSTAPRRRRNSQRRRV